MLAQFFFGFSSGLPLLLISGSTLQAWMTDASVDLKVIGVFSLVGLPYNLKFIWAPFLDRFAPPFLDRRRGWILLMQLAMAASLFFLSSVDPKGSTMFLAVMTVICAFFSSTHDIAVDAYRRDVLSDEEIGLGSSLYTSGYRVGMIIASSVALIMADHLPWDQVYKIMALIMAVQIVFTIFAPRVEPVPGAPQNFKDAVVLPFKEFFSIKDAWIILAFILLYKIGDNMASNMTMPLYLGMGYTKTEVGSIVKLFGIWATILGGFAGGFILLKISLSRCLWIFGLLQAVSTLGFAFLAAADKSNGLLTAVISFENLTAGMGTAAFMALMAKITDKRFTATQYALLTALSAVPRTIISSPTGYMMEHMGAVGFFVFCAVVAIPGMLLLFKFAPWSAREHA